jgi:hypothetical protein
MTTVKAVTRIENSEPKIYQSYIDQVRTYTLTQGNTWQSNPFSLKFPPGLEKVSHFFDLDYISANPASEQFNSFLKEYYLFFVNLLEAINGSKSAKSEIRERLETNTMYEKANIDIQMLRSGNASVGFRRSCLAHLAITVLCSPEGGIHTAARVYVLKLLPCYNLNELASSFVNSLGFEPPCMAKNEHKNLSQRISRDTSHNDLSHRKTEILEIFQTQNINDINIDKDIDARTNSIDLWAVTEKLQLKYPAKTVQTLLSILLIPHHHLTSKDRRLAFLSLAVDLTKLPPIAEDAVFGGNATYRADN